MRRINLEISTAGMRFHLELSVQPMEATRSGGGKETSQSNLKPGDALLAGPAHGIMRQPNHKIA